ncbi:hypothetical protein UPYG_G00237290 [Umbra pygmaea]|uniref:C-type lectin domain-containing protein n=1 Tax=Umbra pygmaea TaxID=75934 RepID=A0ABD0WG65_UMBPY
MWWKVKFLRGHEEVTYSGVKTAVGQQVKDSKPFSGDSSQVVGSKVVTPELGSHRVALVMLLGVCFLLLCLAITLGALYASIFTSYQAKKASFQTCLAQQKNETVKQCDTGWQFFNRSCYYFSDDKLTWEESQYACIHDGGHLVIIESLQEQEFLRIKVGNPGYTDSPWIGMTDQETEGTWVWVDNTILNDNNKCLEAVRMSGDVIYTNVTFVNQDNVVESKVSKGHEEVTYSEVKTAAGQQVKDASIFTSYQAKKASFQTCLAQQKNETVKQCDTGWQFFNRSCYYFSDDKLTWEESQYACIHDGGHLVIIESLQEQEFLRIKVGNPGYEDSPWIGMTDQKTEGTWVWVDSTTLNDNNKYWDQNNGTVNSNTPEPTNSGGQEHCAGIGKRCSDQTPCWFDFNCGVKLKRICESRAASP